jgi:[ribulose-bisphosphate carboxylase]-lysine N-methyltransferase
VLRADTAPDERLLPVLRLLNLAGADAFLLESIFRGEVWEHMQLPISEENERGCYQVGEAALGGDWFDSGRLLRAGRLSQGTSRPLGLFYATPHLFCLLLQQLIDGCNTALAAYPTSIDEDLALLNGWGTCATA